MIKNGYTKKQIHAGFSNRQKPIKDTQPTHKIILPYIKGTTDKIKNILKKHDILTIFKPQQKISTVLGNPKDKVPLETPGVYKITCQCDKAYIGMSSRKISTRQKEHVRAIKNNDVEKSAIAEHVNNTKHDINFDNTKVLARGTNFFEILIRESIEISKGNNLINKEQGFYLSPAWTPLIHKIKNKGNKLEGYKNPLPGDDNTTSVLTTKDTSQRSLLNCGP